MYRTAVSTSSPAPRRSDALRNREAIVAAARELFAESSDVAMHDVARRAGVGQATLYRNFPDREALVAALAIEWVEELERLGNELAGQPDAFLILLRAMVDALTRFHGLVDCATKESMAGELEPLQQRLSVLLDHALRDAKRARLVRRDLTLDDVKLLMAMVAGALEDAEPNGREAAARRALALALGGVATGGSSA